jgi:hypothetical protein
MRKERDDVAPMAPKNDNVFNFGISGHRDLVPEDLPALRQQLREIFRRAISARPTATFRLLTPLAEGADRVAAEEALSLGIKLVVPIPMMLGEYERDFETADSLADFRRLLKTADEHFELADTGPKYTTDKRTQSYAAVGDYIARHSDLLVLLWDGKENQKVGGTGWVRKRREHWVELANKKGAFESLQTIHVPTRRTGQAGET